MNILYLSCLFYIYFPLFFYPIPYLNTKWISQPLFIQICQLRVLLLAFFFIIYNTTLDGSFFSVCPISIMFGMFFFVLGQIFNLSVYALLGTKGVYYGLQYRTIPPLKISTIEFPFCFKHPLYIGGCISYFGILLLTLWKEYGMDSTLLFLWFNVEMVQFALMLMESFLDKDV